MPSARRKAFLLTFVAAWTKVRRLAGRDPPVLLLVFGSNQKGNKSGMIRVAIIQTMIFSGAPTLV